MSPDSGIPTDPVEEVEKVETDSKSSAPTDDEYPGEVQRVNVGEREFILVGTAHVSRESVDLVRRVIETERPDCVCVELDAQRYESLKKKKSWEQLDIKQVIRKKQLSTLLVNLLLASYQKRLGLELGVEPGTELLEATRVAEELGMPVELCDRDVRVTLRRAARETSLWRKMYMLSFLLATVFEKPEISEEQMAELRQQDVLNELMGELGQQMPALKRVLIDERDTYLSTRILDSTGNRVVAVVGAGHLDGIRRAIENQQRGDLETLDVIPPVSPVWKVVGWAVPALILGSIGYIGYRQGFAEAGANLSYWFFANAIPASIGAVAGLLHPLTIAAAFFGAPITSLTPVIGAGYLCAFVQAWVRPPTVKEIQNVADDVGVLKMWWKNRLLKVFLAFTLPGIGSLIGTWIGGFEILSNLRG